MSAAVPPWAVSTDIRDLSDTDLASFEHEENQLANRLREQLASLQLQWRKHDLQRRQLARERLRRSFACSSFGRLIADSVLPFLNAGEALRWFGASSATAAQLSWPHETARRVHHLRGVAESLTPREADLLVGRIHWPSVQTIAMDLGEPGWATLLRALGEGPCAERHSECGHSDAAPAPALPSHLRLRSLRGLAVSFPPERSAASLGRWRSVAPAVACFGQLLQGAPLRELVLTDLRSTEALTAVLDACSAQLTVCRASFIGPESRRWPLELPAKGMPALECLMVKHRDFAGQRASRRDRMRVSAAPLLACLRSIAAPRRLRVLALAGVCVEGSSNETAALLRGLSAFSGLVAVALRFSVPSTFGTLLPLPTLIDLRCAWPFVGHFAVADMSLHGFDYWPEQMTDFQDLYPHGGVPRPFEVFHNEFGHVLSTEYGTTAEAQWRKIGASSQSFWAHVAARLPAMPRSEVRFRVAELFPSCL